MKRLASLLPLFLFACSSNAQQFADSGPPEDAGNPSGDAAAAADGATKSDAGPPADGAVEADAASNPFVPHPPAGATKCGAGTIDAASAETACTAPCEVLDYEPLPDGGNGAVPRSCGALTIGSGEWQAWCTATEVYLWSRIPITNANVLQDCHGTSLLEIDLGYWESGSGGGNSTGVGTYELDGTEIAGTPPSDPQVVVTTLTLPSTQGGSAQLFVAGNIEDTCQQGFYPPTVLTGFDATWKP